MKFIVLKKQSILTLLLLIIIVLSAVLVPIAVVSSSPQNMLTVVIDAGHGGIDPGCTGTLEGSNERELNLIYANTLKKYFQNYGINVVMTRTNTDGLYSAFSLNKKKDDMKKRQSIIEKSNADIVISMHMNSYPLSSSRGAQVFYNPDSEISKHLATSIQDCFISKLPNARKAPEVGDYYMLNCTNVPAVIIECGFLSNIEEEKLLLSAEYREKVCYTILCGIIKYYNE